MTPTYSIVLAAVVVVGFLFGWYGHKARVRYVKPRRINLSGVTFKPTPEDEERWRKLMSGLPRASGEFRGYFDDGNPRS